MATLGNLWHFYLGPGGALVMTLLFTISEHLGQNPKVAANSVYQFLRDGIRTLTKRGQP